MSLGTGIERVNITRSQREFKGRCDCDKPLGALEAYRRGEKEECTKSQVFEISTRIGEKRIINYYPYVTT